MRRSRSLLTIHHALRRSCSSRTNKGTERVPTIHNNSKLCGSYDHDTNGHNRIISLKREINPRNPQHAFKRCEACDSSTHTITDHYDIKWFKRGEALQAKKAKALKLTRAESSNANRSKTPTKSGCSRHMTGVKSYLHKYVEQPGPKVVFGDDSTCTTEGYGSIKCNGIVFTKFDEKRGTIFNSNKEIVMIAPRVRDVYVLDMTSSAQESCSMLGIYRGVTTPVVVPILLVPIALYLIIMGNFGKLPFHEDICSSLMSLRVMSSPNHPTFDIEDAFSSNFPDYIPASPDYFPASPGNTSSESSNNSSGLVPIASPTLSLFHNDPYMKVMQAYYTISLPHVTILPPTVVPPSPMLSLMFDSRDFFPPEEIPPPKDTETPVESPIPISPSSSVGSSSPIRSTTPPPDYPFDESIFAELDNSLWIIPRPLGSEPVPEESNESNACLNVHL
ncbi:hypothetical protein Tco_0508904 [Tanacetum coccineum]